MSAFGLLLITIFVTLPIAWLITEFRAKRPVRITFGILALLSSFSVAAFVCMLSRLKYNAWYGGATKDLVGTTIEQIEDGHLDRVLKVLRGLDSQ